jgi:hypothetical protein
MRHPSRLEWRQMLGLNADNLDAPPTVFYDKTPSWYYTISPNGRQVAFGSRNQLEIRDRETCWRTNSVWLVGRPYLDQLLKRAARANSAPRQ